MLAYFIALPIFFECHARQHQHENGEENSDELVYAIVTPDCEICDLYYSQVGFIDVSFSQSIDHSLEIICAVDLKNQPKPTQAFSSLRGPPFVFA